MLQRGGKADIDGIRPLARKSGRGKEGWGGGGGGGGAVGQIQE